MAQKFNERFGIETGQEEARKRFVNRVQNEILSRFWYRLPRDVRDEAHMTVLTILGIQTGPNPYGPQWQDITDDFWLNVRTVEAMYQAVPAYRKQLSSAVEAILSISEIDLGIRWDNDHFLPSGAPVLDDKLVNDVLNCLTAPKYEGVRKPFHKGLEHLLQSVGKPQFLADVVTDTYEAVEALAKIVTGRDKDLSANAESFISAVKVSEGYKRILKEYIDYANKMGRHAGDKGQPKPTPTRKEVESFIYLTGLFIRLALVSEEQV